MIGRKLPASKQVLCTVSLGLLLACGTSAPPRENAPEAVAGAAKARTAPPLPRVDVHMHVDLRAAGEALAIMAEQNIVIGLNASGGEAGFGLEASQEVAARSAGRLLPLCNLRLSGLDDPRFPAYVTGSLERCRALGGKGLKIAKVLGLGIFDAREELVPVDDARLDIVFETAGRLELPVLIHSADPKAFFEPPNEQNERYAELRVHPGWSFYGNAPNGKPWPSWQALLEQLGRRIARHPGTIFMGAHFGNAAEEPERVARMLSQHANYVIDTAARVPEFGRHDAARMRALFIEHQDRILFGSDLGVGLEGLTLGSGDERPGTRAESRVFFERHFLYFETRTSRMPHPTPIQGNWTVDGIGLPRAVLKKLYADNAVRIFKLKLQRD
jgi:predicted TIM-barrel fold metal-dependent hydrolase